MTKVDMHIPGKSDLDVSFDGSRKIHQEAPFERYISRKVAGLEHSGWALSPDDTGFDPNDALVFDDFVAWLEATAPEKLDKMRREKGARWADQLKRALVKSLERNGTVLTLRKGFQMAGYQTIECMAGYPDDERVPGARERYDANILRFMHQVHYQTAGSKSLDFVLFVNGIPVATGEVKTELTQTVRDAIDEYADERKPVEPDGGRKNPLLMYKRGAVVHFAVSEDEVWMCTNLGPFPSKSARPRFLPFNLGRDGGAGNPDAPEGEYRTHYLWDTILQRDNWLSIFDRFVFEEVEDNPFALIERGYEYTEANMNPTGQGPVERAFDRPESRLLIVANKFQTGFDQKKLVALYVDKPLGNAIEIVQTYSRVNRTCSGKDRVFVVDFVNDPETVLAAFKTYDKGATMSAAQDPNVVYDLKDALDAADVFATRDVEGFKEALYRSKGLAAGGESDAYRTALYSAVSGPAEIFRERFAAARDSYETWLECANRAEAAGEAEEAERAKRSADEAAGRVAELMTFRKKLSKYCSAYTFLSQALDFGDPDLEVFYSLAKLLGHRIAGTSLDDVDVRGLVLRDFRISAQKVPEGVEGGELMPMGAGGSGAAPKRDTMARIVERLNRTWGDEGDPLVKARAVNAVSDAVAADPVTNTQITNTSNTKEAVLADGLLRNIVIRALMSMMSNELGDLAEQALDDPQAIEPLADQVYDLISQGKRYDIAELASYLSKGE